MIWLFLHNRYKDVIDGEKPLSSLRTDCKDLWGMKIRMIIGNLLVAYIVFPMIYIHNHWANILSGSYTDGYTHYTTLSTYLHRIYNGFFLFSTVLLIGSLLPFQLFKHKYLYKIKKYYFIKSVLVYILINVFLILLTGYGFVLSMSIGYHFQTPFLWTLIAFSVIAQSALYIFVDKSIREPNRKEE